MSGLDAKGVQWHCGHHSWIMGKLGCKSRTKNGRNVAKVSLERSERE